MVERHPKRERLDRFGSADLSRQENREIIRHLLSGCARCRQVTERFLSRTVRVVKRETAASSEGFLYASAFAAARRELGRQQKAFAAERAAAPSLLAELVVHPFDRQWLLVTEETRFQSWALCDLLLEESREWGFQDPGRALDLAQLGAAAAAHLDPAVYGPARINDLAARAWSTLANALRIRSDFRSAEKGFARAEQLLKEGTGDPLEKAWMLLLKASLRGNQGRFREAARLLDQVAHIAARNGDLQLVGKAFITKGFLLSVDGKPEEAIELLTQGLLRIAPESLTSPGHQGPSAISGISGIATIAGITPIAEPRLHVAALHNLILCLNESGHPTEALALLGETRPLYAALGDRMNLMRLQWVEGKIALTLGKLESAETLLKEVREELVSRELGYDAALLSLDLARIYAQEGRSTEMRRLAEEMLPIFQSRDVRREILATLLVFQKAAEMERVTLDLVQELSAYLLRCRKTSAAPDPRQRGPL